MKYLKLLSILMLVITLCLSACIKKSADTASNPVTNRQSSSPEEVVKDFIDRSAAVKNDVDRLGLQSLCIGEMRRTFERMTTEAFRIAYINSHVRIKQFRILEKSHEGETARVRYQVEVENTAGTDPTHETNEREVELSRSQGTWFIESIRPAGSDRIAFTRGMIF